MIRGGHPVGEDPFTKHAQGVVRLRIQDIRAGYWRKTFLLQVSFEEAEKASCQDYFPKTTTHMDTIISSILGRPKNIRAVMFGPFTEVMVAKNNFLSVSAFTPEAKENRVSKKSKLGFELARVRQFRIKPRS